MVREDRQYAARAKRRSSLVPVIVGGGMFAVLLVTAAIVAKQTGKDDAKNGKQPVAKQTETRQEESLDLPSNATTPNTVANATEKPATQNVPTAVQRTPKQTRLDDVRAHVAAGEFGPALDIAEAVADRGERTDLLRVITTAMTRAGEFVSALAVARRIPNAQVRTAAHNDRANQAASAAGGVGADFGDLINLIKSVTSGIWEEDDPDLGGSIEEFETGVRVDAFGQLRHLSKTEMSGSLKSRGLLARKADLNKDMAKSSSFRIVSLTRLEREIQKRIAEGKPVVETMKNFAGLQKIEYVFVVPESGEILVGGPAEGWNYNAQGLPVGANTGRPTLQLDDFVTVFRTFSRGGSGMFNCLIVPRQEGLRKATEINDAQSARGPLNARGTKNFVRDLTEAMGDQDVKVNGIPLESRVARVIVDADYRMKLIGIDRLQTGPDIPSYFDLLSRQSNKHAPKLDALRWWLTMKYDAVLHSADKNAFQIQGSSVRCQGLNEKITADGRRIHTGKADPVNLLFAKSFTDKYRQLAADDVVFADMQNIFDLSLVAALIRHEKLDRKANWQGGAFSRTGDYRPAVFEPVKTVMSVSNHRVYRNGAIVVQVAGGVRADLMAVVRDQKLRREVPRLGSLLDAAKPSQLPEGRWWWDAKK